MTTYLTIIGRNIRDNIHRSSCEELAPVIAVYQDGIVSYGLGAIVHGDSRTVYVARPEQREVCGAEVYIKTEALVELLSMPLVRAASGCHVVYTNTHHSKYNRRVLAATNLGMTLAFKPVVSVRAGKGSKVQACMEVYAIGTSYLVYAAPGSTTKPMSCGARVWQEIEGYVTLNNTTTTNDMDDMHEIGQIVQASF